MKKKGNKNKNNNEQKSKMVKRKLSGLHERKKRERMICCRESNIV